MLIFQKVFAPSTTNLLPQSFGKRGVFVHSWRVNWEGKLVKGEGSWDKNYGFGLAGKHGYTTGRSTTSAVQSSLQPHKEVEPAKKFLRTRYDQVPCLNRIVYLLQQHGLNNVALF